MCVILIKLTFIISEKPDRKSRFIKAERRPNHKLKIQPKTAHRRLGQSKRNITTKRV